MTPFLVCLAKVAPVLVVIVLILKGVQHEAIQDEQERVSEVFHAECDEGSQEEPAFGVARADARRDPAVGR